MASFDSWLASVEDEFWKAHNEVMNATGLRQVIDALTSSSENSGSFFAHVRAEVEAFYRSVNWSEPFFRYLAAFHALIWIVVLYGTRGSASDERLIVVCVMLTCTVLAGVVLNNVGRRYASSIFVDPDVNYFSEDGIFIAAVFMAPMIVLILCLQLRMVCRAMRLMVEVKRAQVKRRLRREAKQQSAAAESSSETKKEQ
ncbi:hypothetical protein ABB37_01446 [Leptomonas pyrrhocoris]|uniref:Uncharacterized protein n=1 Tax=Leptomonas pyrrhocoris TaxID=157538 RepID=A0A0M9G8K8_LEPPY|nr:hypothetical protein ABB37_01446 [Leptomonas pyrrhocoris]KPA85020.1 hypothetical protein ABB37_01446 [Leptomonas pyrrhocoris]|eukprot:XP_015663459.1 hypothetical protein ABB37_01446 [Leptomonas pyrrhocoris]